MFASRQEAGRLLGERLRELSLVRPVVLGITRGGVVVAAQVAKILKAPLYPLVIKKIGHPYNPEFALGAMGPDYQVVGEVGEAGRERLSEIRKEIGAKKKSYGIRDTRYDIRGRIAIIVDDGIATGWTIRAAVQYATGLPAGKAGLHPVKVVVAVPVADSEIIRQLGRKVDRLVVLEEVDGLGAVGNYYEEFPQVSDDEVKSCVREADQEVGSRG